jgi:hypothetical protein
MASAGRLVNKMEKNANMLVAAAGSGLSYLGLYDNRRSKWDGRGRRPPEM